MLTSARSTRRSSRRLAEFEPEIDRFERGRSAALARLRRAGLSAAAAERWLLEWDVSTSDLEDFRPAGDFWDLGYQYVIEERRRGHQPPPIGLIR
jgi:hypothetical protein